MGVGVSSGRNVRPRASRNRARLGPIAMNLLGVVATVLGVVLGTSASADQVGRRDPKEFPTLFNISSVSHGHGHPRDDARAWVQHKIRMYKPWRSRRLRRYGDLSLTFPSRDRRIDIFYRRGLRARMTKRSGRLVGHPTVWRPDRRTVAVSFPSHWLGSNEQRYNWHALAVFAPPCDDNANPACPAVLDLAPNRGNMRHRL
jgi:hypothetical protein